MFLFVRLGPDLARAAGTPVLQVELPDGATAGQLLQEMRRLHPDLDGLLGSCVVTAGGRIVGRDEPLPGSGNVAVLQPMAGGGNAPGGCVPSSETQIVRRKPHASASERGSNLIHGESRDGGRLRLPEKHEGRVTPWRYR